MSALPLRADIALHQCHVRKGPEAVIRRCAARRGRANATARLLFPAAI